MKRGASTFKSKVQSELEILQIDENLIPRFFHDARHTEEIVGIREENDDLELWRKYYKNKERMKTVSVALVLCLHIGVDPPDPVPKPRPCAKLEAWVDPFACGPTRAAQKIALSLTKSYERWQPRARYKTATDPTMDDVKKLCVSMRKNAKDEHALFHYNGHGVPRPTHNGEIWVFNKTFTQYIPLSIYDLQTWMESPSIYVWDCSSAETIVVSFNRFADEHEREWKSGLITEYENQHRRGQTPLVPLTPDMYDQEAKRLNFRRRPRFKECVQLAACGSLESLPTNPELPADLFTSCLTTPIQTSILWYLVRSGRRHQFSANIIEEIPGTLSDRRTILGELNWIFTSITDTIAWNTLPREDFQRLFRQDLLLASLFRSFLLAERIMGANNCTVISSPRLPPTADHPLWDSWEYTLDMTMNYIYIWNSGLRKDMMVYGRTFDHLFSKSKSVPLNPLFDPTAVIGEPVESQHSWFFIEQLRAFEVWLQYTMDEHKPPQQLPIVLQVLLSQTHRVKALELLARFLDLGQWAVGYSLSVGIFPYVSKLLQSNTKELRPWLAFIWAKILAVDPSVQVELFKEFGEQEVPRNEKPKAQLRFCYFLHILNDPETTPQQKIIPAFIVATLFHNNYKTAQENLTEKGYVNLCMELLNDPKIADCRRLKLWILIGLGRLWADFNKARWQAVRLVAYNKVLLELEDNSPEVRAAAVYALGCLVKNRSDTNEHAAYIEEQVCLGMCKKCTRDGSVLVREEFIVALQWYVIDFEQSFAKLFLELCDALNIDMRDVEENKEIEHDTIDAISLIADQSDRSRSSLYQSQFSTSSFYRRKKQHSESGFVLEELVDDVSNMSMHNSMSESISSSVPLYEKLYIDRALKQIKQLEAKTFLEPQWRTWLSLLYLSVDPVQKVARMAQVLVRRIEQVALDRLAATQEKKGRLVNSSSASCFDESTSTAAAVAVTAMSAARMSTSPPVDEGDEQVDGAAPIPHNPVISRVNEEELSTSIEKGGGVKFMVGSPMGTSGGMASGGGSLPAKEGLSVEDHHPLKTSTPKPPERKNSHNSFAVPALPAGRDGHKKVQTTTVLELMQKHATQSFTPKRSVVGRGTFSKDPPPSRGDGDRNGTGAATNGASSSNANAGDISMRNHEPLVNTEFVEWCSRIFVEPILDVIHCNDSLDNMTDRMLIEVNPTDWAYHTRQGHLQAAATEFNHLRHGNAHCKNQIVAARIEKPPKALCFSYLRKCIYSTDGDSVFIHHYERNAPDSLRVKRFTANGGNPFVSDKTESLLVINEMSSEMLVCASHAGTVRVWDPGFDIHSHEFAVNHDPTMITAACPLAEVPRISDWGSRSNSTDTNAYHTIYDWCQDRGQLVLAGNVRVVRLWDAQYEKTAVDVKLGTRKPPVTALSADLDNSSLIALGFRDGSIELHDTRMQGTHEKGTLIASFQEQSTAIVGIAIRSRSNASTESLLAASADGSVCIWEPRNYKELVYQKLVTTNSASDFRNKDFDWVNQFVVHENGELIGCALSRTNELSLYNVNYGTSSTMNSLGSIRHSDIERGRPIAPIVSVAMHKTRCMIALGLRDGCINVYGTNR